MTMIANLLDPGAVGRLAEVRARAAEAERAAAAAPVRAPACEKCGRPLPAPAAVFRDGTAR